MMDSKDDPSELLRHQQNLRERCRLCGMAFKNEKTYDKEAFADDIYRLYSIDVKYELAELYPPRICNKDAHLFYRYRETQNSSNIISRYSSPKMFVPHSINCNICFQTPTAGPGRPKKQILTADLCNAKKRRYENASATPTSSNLKYETPTELGQPLSTREILIQQIKHGLYGMHEEDKQSFFSDLQNCLTVEEESMFMNCIGKAQRGLVSEDAESFHFLYKDTQAMSEFKISSWLKRRNKTMVSYLLGLYGFNSCLDDLNDNQDGMLLISRAVEQLYSICSRSMISPVSFLLNISAYALTGSKLLVDLLGKANPAGQYKAITRWLKDQSSSAIEYPAGDLMNVFDNEQVIGKTYSIKPRNKVALSIITNKGFVALQEVESLQLNVNLKPAPIFKILQERNDHDQLNMKDIKGVEKEENDKDVIMTKLKETIHEIIDQSSPRFQKMEQDHYEQLYHFIDHAIECVKDEQILMDTHYSDFIDDQVIKETEEENYVKCEACGTINGKRKIVCTGCNQREGLKSAKLKKKKGNTNIYKDPETSAPTVKKFVFENKEDGTNVYNEMDQFNHVKSNHKGAHELILTDPVFCNPNSMITVARVLRQIGKENGIMRYGGEKRHWTFVCCDGLPYMIIKNLKEEAVICAISGCNQSFLSKQDFINHANEEHPNREIAYVYEFDWFYLRIGAGHYEMNLIKSFFELNWTPFMEPLCERMGFESEASKRFAKSCKDHHKSWRLLLVFHLGALQELVLPYVRHCLLTEELPYAKGFLKYCSEMYSSPSHSNLRYLMDQVCRFSQGIINFRMSTRRNNASIMKSSKYMTKELFHGRAHPKYQIIEVYDTLQDQMMSEKVRDLNDRYTSITTSGNISLGEDLDFILEEKNKQVKSWLPKGLPSDLVWQTVCRNNKILDNIKVNSLKIFGIEMENGPVRSLNIEDAISSFRVLLRRSDYITKNGDHVSLSGIALDEGLANFLQEATKKRIHILKTEFLGLPVHSEHYAFRHPIPVTPEERQNLHKTSNMTIKEIQFQISKQLEKITDPFQYDYHNQLYQKEVKTKTKAKLVHFLQDLSTAVADTRYEEGELNAMNEDTYDHGTD